MRQKPWPEQRFGHAPLMRGSLGRVGEGRIGRMPEETREKEEKEPQISPVTGLKELRTVICQGS